MGPTAAVFGRDFELFMNDEDRLGACPIDRIEESISRSMGTLNKSSFEGSWESWNGQSYSSSSWK